MCGWGVVVAVTAAVCYMIFGRRNAYPDDNSLSGCIAAAFVFIFNSLAAELRYKWYCALLYVVSNFVALAQVRSRFAGIG